MGRAQSLRWEDVGPQIIMQLVCTVPRRLADNLPAATVFRNLKTGELQYEDGFKIGFTHQGKVLLNNHLTIIIKFHRVKRYVRVWTIHTCSNCRNVRHLLVLFLMIKCTANQDCMPVSWSSCYMYLNVKCTSR